MSCILSFRNENDIIAIILIFLRSFLDIPKIRIFAVKNFEKMKKCLIIVVALLVLALPSCKKTRYCRCTTVQNEEVVELGSDFYTIEDGSSCSDRAKEIVGWGQVICSEVSQYEATGENPSWWENLFGGGKN